jgi:hypothetical protein
MTEVLCYSGDVTLTDRSKDGVSVSAGYAA